MAVDGHRMDMGRYLEQNSSDPAKLQTARRLLDVANQAEKAALDILGLEQPTQAELDDGKIPLDVSLLLQEPTKWFSPTTMRILADAESESQGAYHTYLGTEHFLLGTLKSEELADIFPPQVRTDIDASTRFVMGRGDRFVVYSPKPTPRAYRVIHLAADEARSNNLSQIDPFSMLMGLVREGEGIAAGILERFGITESTLRDKRKGSSSSQTQS